MVAETFPNDTLDAVSLHGQLDVFLGDDQTESMVLQVVADGQEQQVFM